MRPPLMLCLLHWATAKVSSSISWSLETGTTTKQLCFCCPNRTLTKGEKKHESQVGFVSHPPKKPIGSMGLVYVPTFTIKINDKCRSIYHTWILWNMELNLSFGLFLPRTCPIGLRSWASSLQWVKVPNLPPQAPQQHQIPWWTDPWSTDIYIVHIFPGNSDPTKMFTNSRQIYQSRRSYEDMFPSFCCCFFWQLPFDKLGGCHFERGAWNLTDQDGVDELVHLFELDERLIGKPQSCWEVDSLELGCAYPDEHSWVPDDQLPYYINDDGCNKVWVEHQPYKVVLLSLRNGCVNGWIR